MLNNSSTPFTMPVTPCGNGGFGGFNDGGWWLIILFALIFGWGNNGFGGFGRGQSTSVYEGYVLNNDFSQISKQISDTYNMTDRKFEGIANGICSLGYDQQAQMNNLGMNIMNGTNTLQGAIKDCCCQTQQNIADVKYTIGSTGAEISRGVERGFADTNYNLSDKFCQTNFNLSNGTRDVIENQSANTQAILQKLDAMETNRLREKLEAERDARYSLQGQLDRAQLRTQIVDDIRPCPRPAYLSCNPWGCNCGNNNYGTTIA